jgi:hypothetical protein
VQVEGTRQIVCLLSQRPTRTKKTRDIMTLMKMGSKLKTENTDRKIFKKMISCNNVYWRIVIKL